jgi:VanZ family protein
MPDFIYKRPIALAVVWALIIFGLCATPGQYIPSANWLELLSVDKLVHAGMFFTLTALLFTVAAKYRQGKGMLFVYFLSAVLYGVSLELMQAFYFSNRSADWKDVIANTFGCTVALLFLKKISSHKNNGSRSRSIT